MKAFYFLPLLSINLFAHIDNTIHSHYIETLVQLIIFFASISLCFTVVYLFKALLRSFV